MPLLINPYYKEGEYLWAKSLFLEQVFPDIRPLYFSVSTYRQSTRYMSFPLSLIFNFCLFGLGWRRTLTPEATIVDLAPVYQRQGIRFTVDRAVQVRVDEKKIFTQSGAGYDYDFLVNATGPYLNFAATPGLGPEDGYTASICTKSHASEAAAQYTAAVARMQAGERQTIAIGTGHATSTCQERRLSIYRIFISTW